jgi:hypothetical protein
MTETEAQRLVTVLVTAFPTVMTRLTAEQQRQTMTTYRQMLMDLDYVLANAALARLIGSTKFMPTVAEIRDTALSLSKTEQVAGGEAWGSVLKAIAREGAYRMPGTDFVFLDPVTAKCVAALGWQNLCLSDNPVAERARFIELYDKLAGRERLLQQTESLPAMQQFRALQERTAMSVGEAISKLLNPPKEEP